MRQIKTICLAVLLLAGLGQAQTKVRASQVTVNPSSNGIDIFASTRQTDTSPSGNFINFKSLAGVTLFSVDINGNIASSGAITVKNVNGVLYVGSSTGQFSSMAACYTAAASGQTCAVTPNWSETFGSQLVMSKNNVGFYFLGAASVNMSTFGILVNDGVIGAFLNSPSAFGGAPTDTGSGTPVTLSYSGSGAAITAGTVGGSNGVASLGIQNINIDISGGSSAIGINTFCTNHSYFSGLSIIGLNASNTQIGIKWNDCATNGNGANTISGLQIIRPKIGMQFNGNFRENDFAGMRIAGLLTPIAGSIGIDFEGNSKNNFIHGGFCASGFITEFNFGGTANFNDIHCEEDLDDGGGGAQDAVFGSGTFNNEIVRTSDIGAYVYTDNGANNCIRNPGSECNVRRVDLTGQNNNIGATTLMAVPANSTVSNNGGLYRVQCYAVVTTAAGTSSTLPNIQIQWTDNDTNTLASFMNCTPSATTNTVGTTNSNSNAVGAGVPNANTISVKPGTNITWQAVNYASNPANAMQYAVHIRLQYLGQ